MFAPMRVVVLLVGGALLGTLVPDIAEAQKAKDDLAQEYRVAYTIITSHDYDPDAAPADTTENANNPQSDARPEAPTVRPGVAGQPAEAYDGSGYTPPAHTEADIAFMQDMIIHHAQAIEMTDMVDSRTDNEQLRQIALRMERSQADEIHQMMQWLKDRDAELPTLPPAVAEAIGYEPDEDHAHHHEDHDDHAEHHDGHHNHHDMHGMLSPEQMDELAQAEGDTFDRLFLEFMIFHHEGAIIMVDDLFDTPDAGQESAINNFAGHVEADQRIEIQRMQRMLDAMS